MDVMAVLLAVDNLWSEKGKNHDRFEMAWCWFSMVCYPEMQPTKFILLKWYSCLLRQRSFSTARLATYECLIMHKRPGGVIESWIFSACCTWSLGSASCECTYRIWCNARFILSSFTLWYVAGTLNMSSSKNENPLTWLLLYGDSLEAFQWRLSAVCIHSTGWTLNCYWTLTLSWWARSTFELQMEVCEWSRAYVIQHSHRFKM